MRFVFYARLCLALRPRNFLEKVPWGSSKTSNNGIALDFYSTFNGCSGATVEALYGIWRVEVGGLTKSEVRLRRLDYRSRRRGLKRSHHAAFSLRDMTIFDLTVCLIIQRMVGERLAAPENERVG